MEIEWAKAMTQQEVIEHNNYIYSKHSKLKGSAADIIKSDSNKLISLYYMKKELVRSENAGHLKTYYNTLTAWDNNQCICGSELREYDGMYGSYWDCINKSDQSKSHKNYVNWIANEYPQPKLYQSSIPKTYLFDIIKENGYKGKLNAKALLEFYLSQGLTDLKMDYYKESSFKQINTYVEVKKVSDAFEAECVNRLKPLYTNVIPQFHVRFRLKGSNEFKVKKMDILCSNEKEVVIYECKTNVQDRDDVQKDTYTAIIKFINKRSDRPVRFRYLIDTDRDNHGFEHIRFLEDRLNYGVFFGFPKCCIDSFLNCKKTELQLDLSYSTGFIPCKECCTKLSKPRDIEKLIINRVCDIPFPGGGAPGENYTELHKEGAPEYYA